MEGKENRSDLQHIAGHTASRGPRIRALKILKCNWRSGPRRQSQQAGITSTDIAHYPGINRSLRVRAPCWWVYSLGVLVRSI